MSGTKTSNKKEAATELLIDVELLKQSLDQLKEQYDKDFNRLDSFYKEKFEELQQNQEKLRNDLEKFTERYGKALQTLVLHADRWKTGLAVICAMGAFAGTVLGAWDTIKAIFGGLFNAK